MAVSTLEPTLIDPTQEPAQKAIIDTILARNMELPGGLMVILNELQNEIGYISETMQEYVALKLRVPVSKVHGVVSFYSFFTTTPRGRHILKFCMGTACYVGGAPQLIEKAKQLLGVEPGETTPDGAVTIELCRCVGACSQAPVVTVDDDVIGYLRPNKFPQVIRRLETLDGGEQGTE